MADAVEALGQSVDQETADELAAEFAKIELVDEEVDHPRRIILDDIVLQLRRKIVPRLRSAPLMKPIIPSPPFGRGDSEADSVFTKAGLLI
jgi:hypothetical protein